MGSVTPYETSGGRRYRVRYRKPDRSQTDKRGFRTKREAEEFLASVEVSKLRGDWIDPSLAKISVAEWSTRWLEAQVQLKPTTFANYRQGLRKHVLPRWATTRLSDITHADVQTWVGTLNQTLAAGGVRQTLLILSGMLKYAIQDGRLTRNPCDNIRLPRVHRKSRGYLSAEQVVTLAETIEDLSDVVVFLAYTGLRWGEMAALRVKDIKFDRHRVQVAQAVAEVGGTLEWGTPKSHESRSVPFPAFLSTPLLSRCENKSSNELVFTSAEGGALRNSNFRHRLFNRAVENAMKADPDYPRVTVHDLRHTAASLAISSGAHVKSVQRMLGHASAAMTLDVYADLFADDLDAVAIALNDRGNSTDVGKLWAGRPETEKQEPKSPGNSGL